MKNKKLSQLINRNPILHYGADDDLSDAAIFRMFLYYRNRVEMKNGIMLFCNGEKTIIRYLYWQDKAPHLGRKYFPLGKIPWPLTSEDYSTWSEEKHGQFMQCIFCPIIEEDECNH